MDLLSMWTVHQRYNKGKASNALFVCLHLMSNYLTKKGVVNVKQTSQNSIRLMVKWACTVFQAPHRLWTPTQPHKSTGESWRVLFSNRNSASYFITLETMLGAIGVTRLGQQNHWDCDWEWDWEWEGERASAKARTSKTLTQCASEVLARISLLGSSGRWLLLSGKQAGARRQMIVIDWQINAHSHYGGHSLTTAWPSTADIQVC